MILQDFIRFRKFTLCRGSASQGDVVTNPGLLLGGCSEWLYLFHGEASLSYPGGVTKVAAGLNDLRDNFGQPLEYTVTSESASWVGFNPAVRDASLLVTILQAGSVDLLDEELDTYIVPIKGSVQANDKSVAEFANARLPAGKGAALVVPEGAICSIVKVVREVAQ
ncbi:hypothetical protein [Pseudomonas aeruginosa]|uniref:hypothetical protein n=1 Tax=Pseudomonas aeruginosa TaxID=287 RepID=UPI002F41756F